MKCTQPGCNGDISYHATAEVTRAITDDGGLMIGPAMIQEFPGTAEAFCSTCSWVLDLTNVQRFDE